MRIGEKLNAKPGKIVEVMRKIANHDFIAKSIGIKGQRYQTYEDVARIMYFEKFGAKKCGTDEINEFSIHIKTWISTVSFTKRLLTF